MSDLPILNPNPVPRMIQDAQDMTVQSRGSPNGGLSSAFPITWMARAGLSLSPWWSQTRDIQLREFWKDSDHLSGAVFTMSSKMTAIPFRVVPRDSSFKQHTAEAQTLTDMLVGGAEFGEGWISFYGKWVEDLITQDNGAFAEIIGPGRPDGPIIGTPVSIAHLDSFRCTRTGDPQFPVIYLDLEGRRHKMHYTRVMYTSQQSSPIEEMYGVGFCSVSRCVNVSQTLIDILNFKQEKLGSRPHRVILITRGGLDPKDIQTAFLMAEHEMTNQGLTRYSKAVVAGSSSMTEADLKVIELAALPDGFDEETSITLGMATIALAFGMDARELFPGMSAGATRADALLQHLKQRGKGPGQILQSTEQLFNFKFLPPYLQMSFDFQDDAEDRQVADIRKVRSERNKTLLDSNLETKRVIRRQMLSDGDLDQTSYERLELEDGKLSDGTSILAMFLSTDPELMGYLDIGVADPLDFTGNDPNSITEAIDKKLTELMQLRINSNDTAMLWKTFQCIAALSYLQKAYNIPLSPLNLFYGEDPVQDTGGYVADVLTTDLTNPDMNNETNPTVESHDGQDQQNNLQKEIAALRLQVEALLAKQKEATAVNVNIPERMEVTRKEVAPQVNVHMPDQPTPNVNVHMPDQPTPQVNVTVPDQPVPQVNVTVPKQDAPTIQVNVPQQPAPQVVYNAPPVEKQAKVFSIIRDANGKMVGIKEEIVEQK